MKTSPSYNGPSIPTENYRNTYFLGDAISGSKQHIPDACVDLVIADPPFGIDGDRLDRHYNRDESHIIPGYVEVSSDQYPEFTARWIAEAERVLRPGGALFLITGYTRLPEIYDALRLTDLREVNHNIWQYSFGPATTRKFVSSHYHLLYCEKPGGRRTFNLSCRYGGDDRTADGRSKRYADTSDVWSIPRQYRPGQIRNKNQLPEALVAKMIQYGSKPGDLVCDFFLGGFTTALVAKGLNRDSTGFEINPHAYEHGVKAVQQMERGALLSELPAGTDDLPAS